MNLERPHGPIYHKLLDVINIISACAPLFRLSHTSSLTGAAGSDTRPVRPLLAPRIVVVRRAARPQRPRHPHITVRTLAGYPVVVLPVPQPPCCNPVLRAAVGGDRLLEFVHPRRQPLRLLHLERRPALMVQQSTVPTGRDADHPDRSALIVEPGPLPPPPPPSASTQTEAEAEAADGGPDEPAHD